MANDPNRPNLNTQRALLRESREQDTHIMSVLESRARIVANNLAIDLWTTEEARTFMSTGAMPVILPPLLASGQEGTPNAD